MSREEEVSWGGIENCTLPKNVFWMKRMEELPNPIIPRSQAPPPASFQGSAPSQPHSQAPPPASFPGSTPQLFSYSVNLHTASNKYWGGAWERGWGVEPGNEAGGWSLGTRLGGGDWERGYQHPIVEEEKRNS